MTLKEKIRFTLKEHYGAFDSYLELKYEDKIIEALILGNIEERRAWVTYNQVILEFKNTLNDIDKVKELQYKLTDDSDPNEVCINVIEGVKHQSPELERLYNKIRNF
jgi:hypothetical protein